MSKSKAFGTRPSTKDDAGKKKPKRAAHPLVGNRDPKVYPFKSVPGDFNSSVHLPLKKRDFAEEAAYFEFQAEQLEAKAKTLRDRAAESRTLGDKSTRQAANKLKKARSTMSELLNRLKKQGVDVASVLKAQGVDEEQASALMEAFAKADDE